MSNFKSKPSSHLPPGVASSAEPLVQTAEGGRPRVLVVDDNDTNRKVLAVLCELFDCDCQTAKDGVEAVETFNATPFDLVLMDIHMPRMNGMDATRAIRRTEEGETVPILAVTASVEPDDVRDYLAAGIDSVIAKPVEAARLLEAIASALGTSAGAQRGVLRR
jgi:CheY-like chemotaxis protein